MPMPSAVLTRRRFTAAEWLEAQVRMDTQYVSCGAILWDWEDRPIPTHENVV